MRKLIQILITCFHHRALFLEIRDIAGQKNDSLLVNALDKHLDRIEYFIIQHQDVSYKNDGRYWFEYWQDRILYEWRRWSSDFYRSWIRPLSVGILGYLTLNIVPCFYFDKFLFYEWLEFSLRPINQIPFYVEGLESMFGTNFEEILTKEMLILRFVGLLQVVWVAIWAFAFAKSIKKS